MRKLLRAATCPPSLPLICGNANGYTVAVFGRFYRLDVARTLRRTVAGPVEG